MKSLSVPLILLALAAGFVPAAAQTISGNWRSPGKVLDNGEEDPLYLNLQQSGAQVSGVMSTIGHATPIEGTITGPHFQLSSADGRRHVEGDLVGGELHLGAGGAGAVAERVAPGDGYPPIARIDLPALHDVPSNGLAVTPPMGWNSWNQFQGEIDDRDVRDIVDAMVASGMRDAGYVYVNLDDKWEGVRDKSGNLQPNKKFPDMKALVDYVHSKGMKFGIYSSPGHRTCAEYPGSYGHERQDAETFASWGIDYLKYDWCGARMIYKQDEIWAVYQKMGDALLRSGRPIVYSLCEYGMASVERWGAKVGGNLWRTTGDIRDTWASMIANIEKQAPTADYAGPGHWNDPDMLEIGNGHMTDTEYRTHMSLWALAAAPLLAGNDIRNMTPMTKQILLNRDVIAVDQDPLGKQAFPIRRGDTELWIKPLSDGSVAVGIVNMGASGETVAVTKGDLGIRSDRLAARDLWAHADVKFLNGTYSAKIPSHATVMLRVRALE